MLALAHAAEPEKNLKPRRTDLKPFTYVESNVPYYSSTGKRSGADGKTQMQEPLDAAESQKHMVVPDGFETKLFAADPEITKPIAMAWDHRGRLWIAETVDYPNNKQPLGSGADRIKICEDTDGDGRADKFTIFADKLSIPTSIVFANGGLIVHAAPETLFLKDTNGDDKADETKVLFSGWGVGDTHAGPSNLRMGLDNWVYGIVGYSGFSGEVGGEKLKFGAGFYRFKADGSKMEYLRSNNNNSWGLGFSEEGILFGSTANGNPSVYLPIPNRYYESVRGWSASVLSTIASSLEMPTITDKVRQVDQHGKFTAAAGHALYTARAYPKEYWNKISFVNEPTGHVTATFQLEPRGSDFVARNRLTNFVASDDEWTAPIMSEVGPDGNMWVIDWYNYIIQHNPTPQGFKNGRGNAYETPYRDKQHGRIYRIVYKEAKSATPARLDPNDAPGLLAALRSDNMLWRTTAQSLLVDRARPDVIPDLIKLTQEQTVDEIGLTPCAIHALWTLQGLGALDGKNDGATSAVVAALKHPSAGVRRNAIQVLPRIEGSTTALLSAKLTADPDAQVRLAAFLALVDLPRSEATATTLASALDDATLLADRWLPDALTAAAAANDAAFLKAVAAKTFEKGADKKVMEIVTRVAGHYARVPSESLSAIIIALEKATPQIAEAVVSGIAAGWPKDGKVKINEESDKALLALMPRLAAGARGQLASLADRLGSNVMVKHIAEIADGLFATVQDEKKSDAERIASANQLISLRKFDLPAAASLVKLITPRSSPEFSRGIIEAVRQSEAAQFGGTLVESLKSLSPAVRVRAISVLLERSEWTQTYVKAAEEGTVQFSELSLDQKTALSNHPNKAIAASAKKLLASGGGLPDADRQKVIDDLATKVLGKGDVAKGKAVFTANCAKCHMHNGEGNKIGPDLTGIAAHPKSELLIHIFDPSRSVEGNFRQYTVIMNNGQVFVGLLTSETKTSIEIMDSEAKVHALQREEVKKIGASNKSLMPEGFEKQVAVESITDLLEFLTARGKFLPLDLRKVATVVSTQGMFNSKDADVERLIFPDWSPKTFEGIPFQLVDPLGDKVPNAIMLYSSSGKIPNSMPKSVTLPCNSKAKAIHFLSGVSAWGATSGGEGRSVTMIVRLRYADGKTEDHELKDGLHFADYIRVIEVPGSKLAFKLREQQIRYLAVTPRRSDLIQQIELVKGPDHAVPVVMAVTVETVE